MLRPISFGVLFVSVASQDLFLGTQCSEGEEACSFAKAWKESAADDQARTQKPPVHLKPAVGYFFRNMTAGSGFSLKIPGAPAWLENQSIYRIAPGIFPDKPLQWHFHYDGLSTPMKFTFGADGQLTMKSKPYESQVYKDLSQCQMAIWSGTGPYINPFGKIGPPVLNTECWVNPSVNPFPFNGQLWLTIDQAFWGRVDPDTLETIPGKVDVTSQVLTAHPACDTVTNECFTNYPCTSKWWAPNDLSSMWTKEICIGKFVTDGLKSMSVKEVSRAKLPHRMLVHHSHEPCMSKNYIIVKLDHFEFKKPEWQNGGVLKYVNQAEDNLWLLYDRRTNASRILDSGDFKFINNHFLNCREDGDDIILDTSPSTSHYLDNYFDYNLQQEDRKWDTIMMPPRRCRIPTDPKATNFTCEKLFTGGEWQGLFDFPTFNPLWKANPASRWWYGTAPIDNTALWMNSVIKGDNVERKVVATWSEPGVYTTEANFIPRPGATEEDDGVLFSMMYDSNIDQSLVVLLEPKTLKLISKTPIGFVIPYHSHGVLCNAAGKCFPNP